MWSSQPVKVQTDHQKGKERWLETWHGYWCQMGCTSISETAYLLRLSCISMFSLQGIVRKKESSELQFFGLKLCLGENDQTASSRLEGELK